jgi:hypothetical protein
MEHKQVDLYIDRVAHKSPEQTDGAALYILGSIDPSTHDLWHEAKGKEDDDLIENNKTSIHLTEWEHFYSAQKNLNPGDGTCRQ